MLNLNLLPLQEKEKVRMELTTSFLIHLGTRLFFLAAISMGLLFSIYLYSSIITEAQLELVKSQEGLLEEEEFKNIEKNLQISNDAIKEVHSLERGFLIYSKIIEEFAGLVPSKIYVKNLSISLNAKQFNVNGYAETREEMLAFKKKLEENRAFSNVYSPISNLLVPKDVNFAFTITLK